MADGITNDQGFAGKNMLPFGELEDLIRQSYRMIAAKRLGGKLS